MQGIELALTVYCVSTVFMLIAVRMKFLADGVNSYIRTDGVAPFLALLALTIVPIVNSFATYCIVASFLIELVIRTFKSVYKIMVKLKLINFVRMIMGAKVVKPGKGEK